MNFVIRWLTTAIAVAVAVLIVPGIEVVGANAWLPILVVGAVLGLINATFGSFIKLVSFGCIIITFGLMNLIINAWLLYFSASAANALFGTGFIVNGFWPAFWGGIVISMVSMLLQIWFPSNK